MIAKLIVVPAAVFALVFVPSDFAFGDNTVAKSALSPPAKLRGVAASIRLPEEWKHVSFSKDHLARDPLVEIVPPDHRHAACLNIFHNTKVTRDLQKLEQSIIDKRHGGEDDWKLCDQ